MRVRISHLPQIINNAMEKRFKVITKMNQIHLVTIETEEKYKLGLYLSYLTELFGESEIISL